MRHLFLSGHYPEEKGPFSDLVSRAMYCPLTSKDAIDKAIELAEIRGDQVSDSFLYPGPRNAAIIRQDGEGFDYPIEYDLEMIYGADYADS